MSPSQACCRSAATCCLGCYLPHSPVLIFSSWCIGWCKKEHCCCIVLLQVCFDNAGNCTRAGKLLEERFPHITFTPCTAHCLDLLLEDIGKLAWVSPTVKSAKALVHYVTNHHLPLAEFRCTAMPLMPSLHLDTHVCLVDSVHCS